jgi:serine protease Do
VNAPGGPRVDSEVIRALLALVLTAASAAAAPAHLPFRVLSVELGLRVVETTAQLRTALGVTADHGVLVTEVEPRGPADQSGLRAGDVVTRVAGKAVGSAADVLDALEGHRPGDEVAVEYVRHGTAKTAQVRLARAEPPRMRMGRWSFALPPGYTPDDLERELRRFRERVERQLRDLDRRLRRLEERPETDLTAR